MNVTASCIRLHYPSAAHSGSLDPTRTKVDDIRAVLAAGVSREQIEDALAVAFAFNTVDRLSRTFGWVVSGPQAFAVGARFLLSAVNADHTRITL